jgi:hypothetical protein
MARPPLAHFVFLSMLLHALAVLLFGAPGGGSREGRALWGSLQVVLQASAPEPRPSLRLDRGSLGALRAPLDAEAPAKREPPAAPAPRAPAQAPLAFPPLLERIVTPAPEPAPPLRVPPPTQIPFVPEPPPDPIPAPDAAEPASVAPAPLAVVPLAPAPPPVVPAVPSVERAPVEVPALAAPPPPVERAPPASAVERAPPPSAVERAPALPPVERPALRPLETDSPRAPPSEPLTTMPPEPGASAFKPPVPAGESPGEGHDAPSTTYDPTSRGLDLDAVRKRAGQIAREGSGARALLPFPMPPAPERKSKEALALEKARKPDCRTAYKELGLLAIAPLIANEFGEGSCRW